MQKGSCIHQEERVDKMMAQELQSHSNVMIMRTASSVHDSMA